MRTSREAKGSEKVAAKLRAARPLSLTLARAAGCSEHMRPSRWQAAYRAACAVMDTHVRQHYCLQPQTCKSPKPEIQSGVMIMDGVL